eukprot:7660164-Pyramimonas_sp.AAC.1
MERAHPVERSLSHTKIGRGARARGELKSRGLGARETPADPPVLAEFFAAHWRPCSLGDLPYFCRQLLTCGAALIRHRAPA